MLEAMPGSRAVRIQCRPDTYDLVVDALWTLEPLAVSEEPGPDGSTLLTAGFSDAAGSDAAMERLAPFHPVRVHEPDPDWVQSWRRVAVPHNAGGFRIRLPEHAPDDEAVELVVDPGATFGFGHVSTRLALELLAAANPVGRTVADVGCGSGVLAVAAALSGAARVDAVDIERDAVRATEANAARNGVVVNVAMGSTEALALSAYDLVLCNVTARTQRELAPPLAGHLGPGTAVVLSGLLHEQVDAVLTTWSAAAGELGVVRVAADGEWRAVLMA